MAAAKNNKNTPEQTLIHDLKAIDVQISNADSFFEQAASNPEVDQMVLYELMEMDGIEKTRAVDVVQQMQNPIVLSHRKQLRLRGDEERDLWLLITTAGEARMGRRSPAASAFRARRRLSSSAEVTELALAFETAMPHEMRVNHALGKIEPQAGHEIILKLFPDEFSIWFFVFHGLGSKEELTVHS